MNEHYCKKAPENELAYNLMWYACECGHQERVWNSRDGVTPAGIMCSSCGGNAYHVRLLDEYAPNHNLHHGQKFFRDGTTEEAHKLVVKRGGRVVGPFNPEDYSFQPGWPCVDVFGHLTEY